MFYFLYLVSLPIMLVIVRSKYKTDLIEVELPHSTAEHLKSLMTLYLMQCFVNVIGIIACSLYFSFFLKDSYVPFHIFSSVSNLFTQILSLVAIQKYKHYKTKKQMKQLRIYCSLVAFPVIYFAFMLYPIIKLLYKLDFF